MRVSRFEEIEERDVSSRLIFQDGKVTLRALITGDASRDFKAQEISFAAGARTKLHTHTSDQALLVTKGRGTIATEREERSVSAGDVVVIPAGEGHWHGASPHSEFAHVSITAPWSKTEVSLAPRTRTLPTEYELAHDRSQIRPLLRMNRGGLAVCTLPPGRTSSAASHKTKEELWYVIRGKGQVWRKIGESEDVVDVAPDVALTIPAGTHFQFRNTGPEPLSFVIATMPPWPEADEAIRVPDPKDDGPEDQRFAAAESHEEVAVRDLIRELGRLKEMTERLEKELKDHEDSPS